MFPKFYYKLLCFDKNIIGQIGVQGLNKYLNLPYKIGLIWGGVGFSISLKSPSYKGYFFPFHTAERYKKQCTILYLGNMIEGLPSPVCVY